MVTELPHRRYRPGRRARAGRFTMGTALRAISVLAAAAILVGTGLGWQEYHQVTSGFTRSQALAGEPASAGSEQNLLIMGLDSRLDEAGNPLPADIYDVLHAGDSSVGGYNANVLMLLHIPGDGSKATAISIPRDDYVDLAGCTGPDCRGKIKEAYGRAFAATHQSLSARGITDPVALEQQSREAGRRAEIATVRRFLGGVPIDHFLEVTLVAFFQIAEVVAPLPVCLNEDTSDDYSGAHFHRGPQEISAAEAVAFVRQRRDPNADLNFTELDRERRQQAFLVALSHRLQETGTLTDVGRLRSILDVARQNIAVDADPDLGSLARTASHLTGGNIAFYTLPVERFQQTEAGEDVNIVDLPTIRSIVRRLLDPASDAATTTTPATTTTTTTPGTFPDATGITLDVRNDSGRTGLAATLEAGLTARGFARGQTDNGPTGPDTAIEYGAGAGSAAAELAATVGATATASDQLPADTVRLSVGTGFTVPAVLATLPARLDVGGSMPSSPPETTSTPTTAPGTVSATGRGDQAPAPTDLSVLTGSAVPCVK